MIINSTGIVLNTIRYSDSSVITKIYTESSGLRSFMVRIGKGKNALSKMSLLQPLSIVEVSFNNDERKGLHNPKSLERGATLTGIPFDTIKTCIALFMAEVIVRSISEEERNQKMFQFLKQAILLLDQETATVNNFHLKFMIQFSAHLGFYPHHRKPNCAYFDLSEGEFCTTDPMHPYVLTGSLVDEFERLLEATFSDHHLPHIGNANRRQLLQKLIDYYRLHLDGMKEITSHKVLEEVLA